MAKRVAVSTLQGSTLDILNVIRSNAPLEYQNDVPVITKADDIPKVGEIICGNPARANQFINSLINRIALVRAQSAVFNNPYTNLKKGFLEFGETVEQIFVKLANVYTYDPEKAEARELKRTLPQTESAFHIMNWRVVYPITVQNDDLKLAFLSWDGVADLIAKIVDSIYTAAAYDEFLLFKYLLIKAVAHGKIYPYGVNVTGGFNNAAVAFRGSSNLLTLMSDTYNEAQVQNTTPRERQAIFMSAMFNAQYDVEVLASAFNMDKADFQGRLYLIDDWSTFDSARFTTIQAESTGLDPITSAELALMKDVKAVLIDTEWFQVYDNMNKFTEKYVASGDYWNYFYHTWKTFSHSPFANAIAFVDSSATLALPTSVKYTVASKTMTAESTNIGIKPSDETPGLIPGFMKLVQSDDMVKAGIGVDPYGLIMVPAAKASTGFTLVLNVGGTNYTSGSTALKASTLSVGDEITFTDPDAPAPTPPSGT